MSKKIFQIKVSLVGSNPEIWRRICLDSNTSLSDFHLILQTTMGWENAHLHQFIKDKVYYVDYDDEEGFFETVDYVSSETVLSDLLLRARSKMVYEYDFGDSWEHSIVLEKVLPADDSVEIPVCIGGERACPPEDCGGVWGYENMLEIIKNKNHPERKEYLEWLGGDFDSEDFEIDVVNELLKSKNFGMFSW